MNYPISNVILTKGAISERNSHFVYNFIPKRFSELDIVCMDISTPRKEKNRIKWPNRCYLDFDIHENCFLGPKSEQKARKMPLIGLFQTRKETLSATFREYPRASFLEKNIQSLFFDLWWRHEWLIINDVMLLWNYIT